MSLSGKDAIRLSREANDELFRACKENPDRLYGLATLPAGDPEAAAEEMERTAKELQFRGALLQGSFQGEFFDHRRFWPIFAKAEELGFPIQLHPGEVDPKVEGTYYEGDWSDQVTMTLSGHGIGWHYDAGIQTLRLILAGIFDAYPGLTLVSGHWGELIPYFLDRLDETLPQKVTGLDHEISYYYKKNIYVTPSGMFYSAPMKLCVERLGADRILWSTDYPYMLRENSLEFLQSMELEPSEREAIGHGNAEKIYHI